MTRVVRARVIDVTARRVIRDEGNFMRVGFGRVRARIGVARRRRARLKIIHRRSSARAPRGFRGMRAGDDARAMGATTD